MCAQYSPRFSFFVLCSLLCDFVEAVAHVVAGEGADGERVAEEATAGDHHHQQADAAAELKTCKCVTRDPATNRTLDKLQIASKDLTQCDQVPRENIWQRCRH